MSELVESGSFLVSSLTKAAPGDSLRALSFAACPVRSGRAVTLAWRALSISCERSGGRPAAGAPSCGRAARLTSPARLPAFSADFPCSVSSQYLLPRVRPGPCRQSGRDGCPRDRPPRVQAAAGPGCWGPSHSHRPSCPPTPPTPRKSVASLGLSRPFWHTDHRGAFPGVRRDLGELQSQCCLSPGHGGLPRVLLLAGSRRH